MANITDRFGRPSIPGDYAGATTVKTARTPGESVLSCFDLSKFPLDTPAYFITYRKEIDPVTGVVKVVNQVSWKALVNTDNNTLTSLILAPGYVDTGNQVGDYVECVPSALWANDLVEGLLTSHNPDGTLKIDYATYATSEKRIGTWIDGRPLYRQVFTGTITTSANTAHSITLGSNIREVVRIGGSWNETGYAANTIGTSRLDTGGNEVGRAMLLLISRSVLFRTVANTERTSAPYAVVLEYTKTTD